MDDESENSDPDEKHVVEDSFEHVDLSKLDLFGIDLVENLHENENLEYVGKVKSFLGWLVKSFFHPWIVRSFLILFFSPSDDRLIFWIVFYSCNGTANEWKAVLNFPVKDELLVFWQFLEILAVE